MTELVKFSATSKDLAGKGSARALRTQGRIPAVVYGGKNAPTMVSISSRDFVVEYQKGGIKTRLVELDVDGKKISALTKDVQLHPVSDAPIHVDFLRVDEGTSVKISIALHVVNEDKCPGVKKGGIANLVSRRVDFLCHPSKIPHHIDIDVAELEIGQSLHINDLKLPEGVQPVEKSNFTVMTIIGRASDEPAAAAAATPAA